MQSRNHCSGRLEEVNWSCRGDQVWLRTHSGPGCVHDNGGVRWKSEWCGKQRGQVGRGTEGQQLRYGTSVDDEVPRRDLQ